MRSILILSLILSLTLFSCNGIERELLERGPSEDYMGLEAEARWVYRMIVESPYEEKREGIMLIKISESREEEETTRFYLEERREGSREGSFILQREEETYSFLGTWTYSNGDIEEEPLEEPLEILEGTLEESMIYYHSSGEVVELERTGREKVLVPEGYYWASRLEGEIALLGGDYIQLKYWFVPHLGFVRMVEEHETVNGGSRIPLEKFVLDLRSYDRE